MSDIAEVGAIEHNGPRRKFQYKCSNCENLFDKEFLRARRIQWVMMGSGGKIVRSRVIGWDCVSCMESDPLYQLEPLVTAPGNSDWGSGEREKAED